MALSVGIDYGTTNTALAVSRDGSRPELALFASREGLTPAFRSVLHVGLDDEGRRRVTAGPDAIAVHLSGECEGRLIQSLKSFLASRTFTDTNIYGRAYALEELVGHQLARVRSEAEARLGPLGDRAVVGRPVRYVDSRGPQDDERAVDRMRRALAHAGFTDVTFEAEPVAAAHEYRARISEPSLTLIADFGGGTTDFSLLRLDPLARGAGGVEVLGAAGVGLAGDDFDARLVRHVVSPLVGKGSRYETELGKVLDVPQWIFGRLERWHHVSFLKSKQTLSFLRRVLGSSHSPDRVRALLHLIEGDLGFRLHSSVQDCKLGLSERENAPLRLDEPPVRVEESVERSRFEQWIGDALSSIESCFLGLLRETGVRAGAVEAVFLTGGSSFVPAVRAVFARTFGAERLRGGEELTTVAKGLAIRAAT